MTTLNKTQTSTIEKMVKSGKSYSAISAAIIALDFVANAKEAATVLESMGIEKGVKRGINDQLFAMLTEKPVTQDELFTWIKANGSSNTWAWRGYWDKTRILAVTLHQKAGSKFVEKEYKDMEKEDS